MASHDAIDLAARRTLAAAGAAKEKEQRDLISFLVRVLAQHHPVPGDQQPEGGAESRIVGRAVIRVDAAQPPVRFEYGPVVGEDGTPTGEMMIQAVEAEAPSRLVVPDSPNAVPVRLAVPRNGR